MTTRRASCRCGQLSATVEGEPVRVSVCHCLACQQRTGSAFAVQARWPEERVAIKGESRTWKRTADSGKPVTYHFCPACGSTVYYFARPHRDTVAIPVGAFADPDFPPPRFSVYEGRQHDWVAINAVDIEHFD